MYTFEVGLLCHKVYRSGRLFIHVFKSPADTWCYSVLHRREGGNAVLVAVWNLTTNVCALSFPLQARALTPQTAETDAIRFLVGTQSLKYDNQVTISNKSYMLITKPILSFTAILMWFFKQRLRKLLLHKRKLSLGFQYPVIGTGWAQPFQLILGSRAAVLLCFGSVVTQDSL